MKELKQTQKNVTSLLVKMSREIDLSNNKREKLLGMKTDSKLMFDSHVKSLCKRTSQKLNALSGVAYQLNFNQRKLLLNAFVTSQFSFTPVM